MPGPAHVVVVGQLARDVVLLIDAMPEPGSSTDVRMRRETLGGKGANQAVAFAQLGLTVGLVAVAGDDRVADAMFDRAHRDGIDLTHVFRRPGVETGLIVEAVDADGGWRYLQDLPPETRLTVPDVEAAAETLRSADAVVVQLEQPAPVALEAARLAREGEALVVVDGLPGAEIRTELLDLVDVLRADNSESALLVGADAGDVDALRAGGRELVEAGLRVVVLAAANAGNLLVWRTDDGGIEDELIPLTEETVVDTTGAGDALVAALTAALLRGDAPPTAARLGVLAAGDTVTHRGGRPTLTPHVLDRPVGSSAGARSSAEPAAPPEPTAPHEPERAHSRGGPGQRQRSPTPGAAEFRCPRGEPVDHCEEASSRRPPPPVREGAHERRPVRRPAADR